MSDNENIEKTGEELETSAAPAQPAKAEKEKKAKSSDKKDSKPGFFQRVARWFREMKSELKKVVWPTPKQTVNNTIVVIVCVIVVAIVLGLFDTLANAVVGALLRFFGKA